MITPSASEDKGSGSRIRPARPVTARNNRKARVSTATGPDTDSAAPWVAPALGLALVIAIAIVYAPVRDFGFVSVDDPRYVPLNPHVVNGLTWDNVAWAFTSQWASYWIPLTWILTWWRSRSSGSIRP